MHSMGRSSATWRVLRVGACRLAKSAQHDSFSAGRLGNLGESRVPMSSFGEYSGRCGEAAGDCAALPAQFNRPSWSARRRLAASSGSSRWQRGRPHRVAARSRTSSAERSGSPLQRLARHLSIHSTCPPQERSDAEGRTAGSMPVEVIGCLAWCSVFERRRRQGLSLPTWFACRGSSCASPSRVRGCASAPLASCSECRPEWRGWWWT